MGKLQSKYGYLTVLKTYTKKTNSGKFRMYADCLCDCGKLRVIVVTSLKNGQTKSCGCYHKEQLSKTKFKHGDAKSKEYCSWTHMVKRCQDKNCKDYFRYGGRGIIVCERWIRSYVNFLTDMGRAPSAFHTLDRIENSGNYEPGNVKWSTKKEQANNRRTSKVLTYNGETKTLTQWCDQLNMRYSRVKDMLSFGRSVEYTFNFQQKIS